MRVKNPLFTPEADAPPPLRATGHRRVRFDEVDSLNIAWHGHYLSYFDDGRVAFGRRYGLSYQAMREAGVAAPIARIQVDYLAPLTMDAEIDIEAILHWSTALRLNFEYRIHHNGVLAARGSSVQLFVDGEGQTLFVANDFIGQFRRRWQQGEFAS